MLNRDSDNDPMEHNAVITPHPAILFPSTGRANDGLVIEMGASGPRFLDLQSGGSAPWSGYIDWGLESPQTVREFTGTFLRVGAPEHAEMEASTSKKDRLTLQGLLQLRATQAAVPFALGAKAAKKELSSASSHLIDDPRIRATFAGGQLPRVAVWFYPAFLNAELKRTRLVIWVTKQNQIVPAILCPDMKVAMFALAAFRGVAACANCGELFTLDSERADKSRGEKYCTAACGQRYRQKLYRLRAGKGKPNKNRRKPKNKRGLVTGGRSSAKAG